MAASFGPIAAGLLSTLGLFGILAYLTHPHFAGPVLVSIIFAANLGIFAGALLHILTRDDLTQRARTIWVGMSVLIVPLFAGGAIVYLLLGKDRTRRAFGAQPTDESSSLPRLSIAKR